MAGTARRLLARRLKELREKGRITQQELAEKAGLDYKHYQSIEGRHPPNVTIDSLERLAKALNVPVADLLRF